MPLPFSRNFCRYGGKGRARFSLKAIRELSSKEVVKMGEKLLYVWDTLCLYQFPYFRSSSENNNNNAWYQYFYNGGQYYYGGKDATYRVRAVRDFKLNLFL